jgi:hypothetical protein
MINNKKAFNHFTVKPKPEIVVNKADEVTAGREIGKAIGSSIKTVIMALMFLAGETLLIWLLWNYVVDYQLTYIKAFAGLLLVRLILRDTISLKGDKKAL